MAKSFFMCCQKSGPLILIRPPAPLEKDSVHILILTAFAMLISQYDFAILTLALPDVQDTFEIPENQLGPLVAFARLGALPALVLGLMADRIGRRKLFIFTLLGFSIFTVATGLAVTPTQFIIFQFLSRVFTSAEEILAVVFVMETAQTRNRGWSIGFLAAMGAMGAGLASLAYGFVDTLPGQWRTLYILAGIPVLYIAWLRRYLPETALFQKQPPQDPKTFWQPLQILLYHHKKPLIGIILVTSLFWFQMSPALNFMSKYLQDSHHYPPSAVSMLFIFAGAFALISNLIAGTISDYIGRKPTITIAIIINAFALLWFYNTQGIALPVAWLCALLGFFAIDVMLNAIGAESFPTQCRTTAAALRTIFSVLAVAAGLFLEGAIYQHTSHHALAITIMIPVSLISIPLIFLLVRETSNHHLQ